MLPNVAINFMYDNENLSDYGMMICNFGNSGGLETVSVGNNLTFNTIKTNKSDKNYLTSTYYEEPLSTTFQICKNNCGNEGLDISSEELTSLLRWLSRKDGYHKFTIYQKGYEGVFFYGGFNNIQQLKIGGILYGLELTFITDSPYAYEDINLGFTTSASVGYNLFNLSTETGHLYPTVFLCRCLHSGDLRIHNSIEDRTTEIKNCIEGEVISIDGNSKIIESSVITHNLYNDFNYNFFRLANTYNNNLNTITTSLPCEITIKYELVRKVGLG